MPGLHAILALLLPCTALSSESCPEQGHVRSDSLLQSGKLLDPRAESGAQKHAFPRRDWNLIGYDTLLAREQSLAFIPGPLEAQHFTTGAFPRSKKGLAFTYYHKTGYDFAQSLASSLGKDGLALFVLKDGLAKNETSVQYANGQCFYSHLQGTIPLEVSELGIVDSPSSAFLLPSEARVLNFYRDPVSLILSGYRYHGEGQEPWWEDNSTIGHMIDEQALDAIFQRCEYKCSYHQLLKSASEEEGILMEALMERWNIQEMVGNLMQWSGNPQVLHLSMDHLAADFNATMSCILRFLDLDSEILGALQELDTSSCTSDSTDAKCLHATSSRQYDNEKLQALLEHHVSWGPDFAAARRMSQAIFQRQAALFGCPMP